MSSTKPKPVQSLLLASRYIILFAIIGSFIGAVAVQVYGFWLAVGLVFTMVKTGVAIDVESAKSISVTFVVLIDFFLIGVLLYIFSIGLYQLFIAPDKRLHGTIVVHNLEQLKEKLVVTISVLLLASFAVAVVDWHGGWDILALGAGIGLVLLALAALRFVGFWHEEHVAQHGDDSSTDEM